MENNSRELSSPTSRDAILATVRRNRPANAEHPGCDGPWLTFDDRLGQFSTVLKSVGGNCHVCETRPQASELLQNTVRNIDARHTASHVPEMIDATIDAATIDDPHALEHLDFAVVPGRFGVAENGAVWISDEDLRHQAICFIPQHIAVVVPYAQTAADALVDNMHQAYQRISFPGRGFGLFMSGPSKTADIEQSLVIGAHGPRSLTVVLVKS
ncbi:MAG: LUD domain-containing protein [Pirellulaceae bacterium]|nr:LUD domain-containing protein [Planctomycetales bacterium]